MFEIIVYIGYKRLCENKTLSNGYNLQRRDRDQHGGGLLTLIKSDFPYSRKQCLESDKLENICYELYVNHQKWLIMGAYKPTSMKK